MIKNMSFKNLIFKKDHTGKRLPTKLAWGVIIVFIFGSFFLSKGKSKIIKREVKQEIIKEREIIAASNSNSRKDEKFVIDLAETFNMPVKVDARRNSSGNAGKSNSKIIVFDATSNYQSDQIVPLGSMVKCLLIHNIVTNNYNAPVIVQVLEDFYFDDKLLLPFGTRIYGTAKSGKERDRVLVCFHTIVFQDGKEVPITSIGLSKDGSAGLTGIVVKKQNKKRILMMAMNFLSGVALGFQDTVTNAVTGMNEITIDSRNAVLEGVASSFDAEARRMEKEIDAAEGYAIVLAGNQLIVYFEKSVDVDPI